MATGPAKTDTCEYTTMTKIGRNDPCHCGSGKKYKRCCLRKAKANPGPPKKLPDPPKKVPFVTKTVVEEALMNLVETVRDEIFPVFFDTLEAMEQEGADPGGFLRDLIDAEASAYQESKGGQGLADRLMFLGRSWKDTPKKRELQERVLARLSEPARTTYDQLISADFEVWMKENRGWNCVIGRRDRSNFYGLVGMPLEYSDKSATVLLRVELNGLDLALGVHYIPLTTMARLLERLAESPPRTDEDFHRFSRLIVDEIVKARTETLDRTWHPIWTYQYDRMEQVLADHLDDLGFPSELEWLPFAFVNQGADAVNDVLRKVYDQVIGLRGLEQITKLPFRRFAAGRRDTTQLAEDVEHLKRRPAGLLLLPSEITHRLKISARETISSALQKARDTADEEAVTRAFKDLATEHLWLLNISPSLRSKLPYYARRGFALLTQLEAVLPDDSPFWQTRIAELPFTTARNRFLRRASEHLDVPQGALTLVRLLHDDCDVMAYPGIGEKTYRAWQEAVFQWLEDWRWTRAGLHCTAFQSNDDLQEAREHLDEGLDQLAALFE